MNKERITDTEILDMIRFGVLVLWHGDVYKFHFSRRKYVKLKTYERFGRQRYNIRLKDRNRTIQANKLIWMIANKAIPVGHIDHEDYDRTNDDPNNLRDRCPIENSKDNVFHGYNECVEFFNRQLAVQHGSEGDF